MGWEHIVTMAGKQHHCPLPRREEWWDLKHAEAGSTWRCDECNMLWRLTVTRGPDGGMTYWAADDQVAIENSL